MAGLKEIAAGKATVSHRHWLSLAGMRSTRWDRRCRCGQPSQPAGGENRRSRPMPVDTNFDTTGGGNRGNGWDVCGRINLLAPLNDPDNSYGVV